MLCRGVFNLRRDRHGDVCLHMGEEPVHMCDEESVISECGRQGIDIQGHGADKIMVVAKLIQNHLERRRISPAPAPETPPPLSEIVVTSSSASDISSDMSNGSID